MKRKGNMFKKKKSQYKSLTKILGYFEWRKRKRIYERKGNKNRSWKKVGKKLKTTKAKKKSGKIKKLKIANIFGRKP